MRVFSHLFDPLLLWLVFLLLALLLAVSCFALWLAWRWHLQTLAMKKLAGRLVQTEQEIERLKELL